MPITSPIGRDRYNKLLEFWMEEQTKVNKHTPVSLEVGNRIPVAMASPKTQVEGEEGEIESKK